MPTENRVSKSLLETIGIAFVLFLTCCSRLCAQDTMDADEAKHYRPVFEAKVLFDKASPERAARLLDSLKVVHSADRELVGGLLWAYADVCHWRGGECDKNQMANLRQAARLVKSPFVQSLVIDKISHTFNANYLKDAPLIDSVTLSMVFKAPTANNLEQRGNFLYGQKRYQEAANRFVEAVMTSEQPNNAKLQESLAQCYKEIEQYPLAIRSFTIALESTHHPRSMLYDRAKCKEYLSDYRGALADYAKSLTFKDGLENGVKADQHIFLGIASCKLGLKEYMEAKTVLNNIKDTDLGISNKGYLYYMKGFADYKLNFRESACKNWSKAGEYGYEGAYDLIKANCN